MSRPPDRMWRIEDGPVPVEVPAGADYEAWAWQLAAEGRAQSIEVRVSRSALACDPTTLPVQVADAIDTRGLEVAQSCTGWWQPPRRADVHTAGITFTGGRREETG